MPRALKDFNMYELMAVGFSVMSTWGISRELLMGGKSQPPEELEDSMGDMPAHYASIGYNSLSNLYAAGLMCFTVGLCVVVNNSRLSPECNISIISSKAREGTGAAMATIGVAGYFLDSSVRIAYNTVAPVSASIAATAAFLLPATFLLIHVPTSGLAGAFKTCRAGFADSKKIAMTAAGFLTGGTVSTMLVDMGRYALPHVAERVVTYGLATGVGGALGAAVGYGAYVAWNACCGPKTVSTELNETNPVLNDVESMHNDFRTFGHNI